MDIDLKDFTLTLGTGLVALGVVYFSLSVSYQRAADWVVRWLKGGEGRETQAVPVILGTILLLATGMTVQNVSENVLHYRPPWFLAQQLLALLASDSADELSLISGSESCRGPRSDIRKRIVIALTPLGSGLVDLLRSLDGAGLETPVEVRTWEKVEGGLPPGRCVVEGDAKAAVGELYYVGKNTDFENHDLVAELSEFQARFNFERSIVYELVVGIYLVCVLYLVRSMQLMWGDGGAPKAAASIVLAAGALIGMVSLLSVLGLTGTPHWLLASGAPYWLPALVIFVCGYRTRRVWKRIAWIATRREGFAFAGPLLRYEGEAQAARVLLIVGIFLLLVLPARAAYSADHLGYLRRVYGYYETVRGAALGCKEALADGHLSCSSHELARPNQAKDDGQASGAQRV